MSRSPSRSPSPSRKRQRLSSPTYDEQLQDLAPEDLDAFDAIDAHLSQLSKKTSQGPSEDGVVGDMSTWGSARALHSLAKSHSSNDLHDDPDNPFSTAVASKSTKSPLPLFSTASSLPIMGFAPASASASTGSGFASASSFAAAADMPHDYDRPPSPEAPPEQDYDSWFNPAPTDAPVAFQAANFASAATFATVASATPAIGFMKASNKGILAPSSAALAKARDILKDIWSEEGTENVAPPSSATPDSSFKLASSKILTASSQRPALRAVENAFNSPGTPSPAGFIRPSIIAGPSAISSPSNRTRPKPFKSPLLKTKPSSSSLTNGYAGSPLNPNRPSGFTSAASQQHPLSISITAPASTPRRQITAAIATPEGSAAPLNKPAPFVTPFKPGMKPGEPGRKELEEQALSARKQTPAKEEENWITRERPPYKAPDRTKFFDLTPPPNRITLKKCGLVPQRFEPEELEILGVSYEELNQITPQLAIYYSFHTPFSVPFLSQDPPPTLLGPQAALKHLLERGCTLATQPWVDNHWGLILWKLAALAALAPEGENDPIKRKWCWAEVIRQLLYRYERELNNGSRPPLRLVVTGDAPATLPMVLCVSDIKWLQNPAEDGTPGVPYPELEVTDGWYRLRAQVDAPMARAVSRGVICIGRKMVVASARLSSEKKDPVEILEAYKSTKLVLSGNSSHMVPWHTKLGFTGVPCVSTLHSLSPDGGNVAALDLVIVKTYPIAYIEFLQDEHGNKSQEGPRNEAEEMRVNDEWKRKREYEASKLREVFEKNQARYEGYIERLERKAGDHFHPGEDDYPPDNVDSLYDELEDPIDAPGVLTRLSANEAGWLMKHIRHRLDMERERFGEGIEKELEELCPARNVRNFRIIIVQDARTIRRPSHRRAQLTAWDVLNLTLSEDQPPGTFEVGHRYMVTNLNPTHQKAWMSCFDLDSEVFMCTGRNSRWRKIKTYRH